MQALRTRLKGRSVAFMSTAMQYAKNGPASEVLRCACLPPARRPLSAGLPVRRCADAHNLTSALPLPRAPPPGGSATEVGGATVGAKQVKVTMLAAPVRSGDLGVVRARAAKRPPGPPPAVAPADP